MSRERKTSSEGDARLVAWIGAVADALLALAKLAVGFISGSRAILADGMHSGSDLVTDVAVLAGLRIARKPADPCHPYGHHRVTTLVAMMIGVVLFGAAGWIAYGGISALRQPAVGVSWGLPFITALASVPIKELLYHLTARAGRRTNNVALVANAWHHRTDAFTSVAAAAGLGGVMLGGPEWAFLDAVTAVVLAAFLLVVAIKIVRDSASELIDHAPDERLMKTIRSVVEGVAGVQSHHAFRARALGGRVEMDIHIEVDPQLSVRAGHDIAATLKREVMKAAPSVVEVIVHVEPADEPSC